MRKSISYHGVFCYDMSYITTIAHPSFQIMITLALVMFTTQIFSTVIHHALYFDISVRSITQALHASSSTSCAVVAKDEEHQNAVEEAGCDFVPFVVLVCGLHFLLQTLYSIADHSTATKEWYCTSTQVARKNLLQQLSVSP